MSLSDITSSLRRELPSFKTPPAKPLSPPPTIGSQAPTSPLLPIPSPRGKPTILLFLRHCGCPFAEAAFKRLATLSSTRPDLHCVAVSNSSQAATDRWLPLVGGAWEVDVVVDAGRDAYAAWGLGTSSAWHAYNPWAVYGTVALGRSEGVWGRATESGSRWQVGGAFAVDGEGVVRWARVAKSADELPDFGDAVKALGPVKEGGA